MLNHRRTIFAVMTVKMSSEPKLVAISSDSDGIFPTDAGICAHGKDKLQFVGITRNLAASVFTHRKPVAKLCISLKQSRCSIVQPLHCGFPFLRSQALCGASGDTFCGGVGFASGAGLRLGLCDVQSGYRVDEPGSPVFTTTESRFTKGVQKVDDQSEKTSLLHFLL